MTRSHRSDATAPAAAQTNVPAHEADTAASPRRTAPAELPATGRIVGYRSAWAASPSTLVLIGGAWLVVSRLVFHYATDASGNALLNGVIVGIAVSAAALFRLSNSDSNPGLDLAAAVFGAWMIASPWVYSYDRWGSGSRPAWNDVITGAVIVVLALASLTGGAAARSRSTTRQS
jgi:SPW repeat